MEQKALKLIMAGLLILSMALTGREAAEYVGAMHAVNALRETGMGADDSGRLCVVVDAGRCSECTHRQDCHQKGVPCQFRTHLPLCIPTQKVSGDA